jgi:SAM-dependent methyltransferase
MILWNMFLQNVLRTIGQRIKKRKYSKTGKMNGNIFKLKKLNHSLRSSAMNSIVAWKIRKYIRNGSKPWTTGYNEFKKMFINDVLKQNDLLECFKMNLSLPDRYGYRLDERAVEYPWLFSRLNMEKRLLLDAGSALNFRYLLFNKWLSPRFLVVYTLAPEQVVRKSNISYVYGDLRSTILKSECFDEIVCISTLEHIGMNNHFLYSKDSIYNEFEPDSSLGAVKELKRLLKSGGRLFITVPYGRYQNLGWLQQFDHKMVAKLIDTFNGSKTTETYFKYQNDQWQVTSAETCSDCRYFDVHNQPTFEADYLAAARTVACIELIK